MNDESFVNTKLPSHKSVAVKNTKRKLVDSRKEIIRLFST